MPKDYQYLTKRRRNQLISHELNHISDSHSMQLTVSNVLPNANKEAVFTFKKSNNTFHKSDTFSYSLNDFDELSGTSQFDVNSNEAYSVISQDVSSLTVNSNSNNHMSLWKDLQTLIIEDNVSHNTANKLLQILKNHGHIELPNDVRILLQTPRNTSLRYIKSIAGGYYAHFGLLPSLKQSIKIYSKFITKNEISLNVNIDGLPIAKSSGSQFWPIMASIEKVDIYTLPFIIGVYHGTSKPSDANNFLTDFVNDFISISKNGIIVSNIKYSVSINAIVCDTPAKCFITYTKGHTGYFSCSKCTQEGDFVHNRVIFPETHNTLRTNDTFKNRSQIEHHTGNSILENLSIGMVSQIPLDYMHLVCLGVVKRLLQLWLRGNKNIRLSTENINSVSSHLIAMKSYIPSEFARKPRALHDVDKWKATEFRQFLLYTGIVIMKSVLSVPCYNHFLSLSVAIRILTDSRLCVKFNAYANSLLLWFVSNFGKIYGEEHFSHNVHNLIHLANDVQIFGCLDNFSCFKFENHMLKIKKKLHNSGKPLQELCNRVLEELQLPVRPYCIVKYPIAIYKRNNTISHVEFQNFKIALNKTDDCAILDDKFVLFILDIFEDNDILLIRAKRFLNPTSFFTMPCDSKKLGIFVISNTTTYDSITIPITRVTKKCLKIKHLDEIDSYITIPLQHTNN